jgi:hypothetical protein
MWATISTRCSLVEHPIDQYFGVYDASTAILFHSACAAFLSGPRFVPRFVSELVIVILVKLHASGVGDQVTNFAFGTNVITSIGQK